VATIASMRPVRGGLTRAAWAALAAQAAFMVVPRLEGAPGYRYEVPLLPLLAAATAVALNSWTAGRPFLPARRALIVALLLFLFIPIAWLRHPGIYSSTPVEIAFGKWLAAYAPETRLAVYDLGAVPYYSGAPWVLDTNAAGPLSPFLGRQYDAGEVLAWRPEFVVLPPDEGTVAFPFAGIMSAPGFRRDYAPLFELQGPDGYRMMVWKRREVRLPDGALEAAAAAGFYQRRVSRSTGGSPKYS
jgi:hypothetical protein